MNFYAWQDIKEIESFREYYEFCNYVVLVDDGEGGTYTDIAFGMALIPASTMRFCLIPHDADSEF